MKRKALETITGLASRAIHRLIDLDIRLVDLLVPQRAIDIILSKADWAIPRLTGTLRRHLV